MFGHKPRWLRHGDNLINLDHVSDFETSGKERRDVKVLFDDTESLILSGITLDDIHYFLKKGKPRTREALKNFTRRMPIRKNA
jgi:hypothetical protein